MEITIDTKIRNKWHSGFVRDSKPDEITIHGTGGGGTYQWVLMGGFRKNYVRGIGLFHYLIQRDGKVIEIIDPDKWVYHSSSGYHDKKTIGIEMLNPSPGNLMKYTDEQYLSLFQLIQKLENNYPIKKIRSHNITKQIFSGGKKHCPGNFDWDKFEFFLQSISKNYKKIGTENYEV